MDIDRCILCFFGLILSVKCFDIKVKEGEAGVFYLPPYSECGTYSLLDAGDHVVLSVFNGTHAQLNANYEGRANQQVLRNGTFMLGLHRVTSNDAGTFYIPPVRGYNCKQYYYSLTLIDASPTWLDWGEWAACSVTCGMNGVRIRFRNCTKLGKCTGQYRDRGRCSLDSCSRPTANWSIWTQWSKCSSTCGQGMRERTRTCSDTDIGCPGNFLEPEVCQGRQCAQAVWTTWSGWTTCSQTCNRGTRYRSRQCRTLQNDETGACIEADKQSVDCNATPCYENGGVQPSTPRYAWTSWSLWSLCHQSCGKEARRRDRSCVDAVTNSKAHPSYCGSNIIEEEGSCDLQACKNQSTESTKDHGSDGGSAESSGQSTAKDIGVTLPLSVIVGTVAVFFILVLMVIVIVLVTRLRKKNRTRANDVMSGAGGNPTCQERGSKSSTKGKKVVSICEESDSHCYAEIDDDIIMKMNKSKSVITLDNPYSELPKSATPSSKEPNVECSAQYVTALNEEMVFQFGNQTSGHAGAGSRHLGYTGHDNSGSGNQALTDEINGIYITPTSSDDTLDKKPQKYVKQQKYVKPKK